MDKYFTTNDLTHLRKWTPSAIRTLLGEPDLAEGDRYLKERVKAAEETEYYKQERARREMYRRKARVEGARLSERYVVHLPPGSALDK